MPLPELSGTNIAVSSQATKLLLTLVACGLLAPDCFAPDSVTLKIITAPGAPTVLKDPLTLNAGTILQGLVALGFTGEPLQENRTTTDNRVLPATLPSMTVATWPLLPGLTSKGMVAEGRRGYYYPNIQEAEIVRPKFHPNAHHSTGLLPTGTWPTMVDRPSFRELMPDKPQFEEPQFVRAQYDHSGPRFLFTGPPELLKNPQIANDPNMLRHFIKTNGVGESVQLGLLQSGERVRRLRSATYWDGVEASNNPRADYQNGMDYETKARQASGGMRDPRDPQQPPAAANDPRPSYNSRPHFNPARENIFLRRTR